MINVRDTYMKNKNRVIYLLLLIALIVITFWLWPRKLKTTHYKIECEVSEPIRFAQLTDLHLIKYNKNFDKIVDEVFEQNPDVILMTGDMIDKDSNDITEICNLISYLSEIAPVYYSYGNHEIQWIKENNIDLKPMLEASGAKVLDLECVDVTINNQKLRIGGYDGYYRTPHMETTNDIEQRNKIQFADHFENTQRQKILLSHIPTTWVDWNRIDDYPVGIIFSGHYHGGQVRFPLVEYGLYAPYIGLFPPNTKGVFVGKQATCVLSAGLGSGHRIPRIYNPPEIVIVDLVPIG